MAFNVLTFVVGFVVLALQPYLPLNPDGKKMLGADHDLQHRHLVPDQHEPAALLRRGPPVVLQPVVLHLLEAVDLADHRIGCAGWRSSAALRGDKHMGNFYVDLWRGTAYVFVPLCLIVGVLLIASGVPMTLEGNAEVDDARAGCDGNGR